MGLGCRRAGWFVLSERRSILFTPWDTPESAVLYKVSGPGRLDWLGAVTRPIAGISVSSDLERIGVLESNYHGDAFMSRIVRP